MKKILILTLFSLILILTSSPAFSKRKKLDKETKDSMTLVIKLHNYMCKECTEGFFDGQKPEGLQFTVVCDDWAFVYKVIVRPNGEFIVKPK